MISKAYEKADFYVVEFDLEDVLTSSTVVHTTTEPNITPPTTPLPTTTLPQTTGGVQVGENGQGDIVFNPSDFFQ